MKYKVTGHSEGRQTVVVFRTCGLGDFILSVPAFLRLRERFPEAHIVLVTMSTTNVAVAAKVASYAGGINASPWIGLMPSGVIDEVVTLPSLRSTKALLHAGRALRRRKTMLVVQMMDIGIPWKRRLKKLAFAALLVGAVRQVGWRLPGAIEQRRVPTVDPDLPHHVHGPLHAFRELDGPNAYDDKDIGFELVPGTGAERWADDWLSNHAPAHPLIAIAPGAVHPHKDWPIDKFVAVASVLLRKYPEARIVVTGTKTDAAKAEQLIKLSPARIFSTCGTASIPQSAALLARCLLVIGNDGGAMHLADAMGTRVVSIVPGLEFPNSIEPWHNIDRAVRHPVPCAPCYSFTFCPEGHNRCMKDLPVAAVLDQISRAMDEVNAASPERARSVPD